MFFRYFLPYNLFFIWCMGCILLSEGFVIPGVIGLISWSISLGVDLKRNILPILRGK